jgi:hypothetical protein
MESVTEQEFEVFRSLAEKLTLISDCPRSAPVLEALTEDLVRMCSSLEEATWLVREAREKWAEWRGVAGLAYLLHLHRFPPLPPSNLAAEKEQKEQWIREGATHDPDWTEKLLKRALGKSAKEELVEVHLKAIRDMLFYTEGAGQRESRDRYWHDQRAYDLSEHPDLVAWVRAGEVGEMPDLTPMSQRKTERAPGVPSTVEGRAITQEDVDRAREEYERQKAGASDGEIDGLKDSTD